MPRDYEDTRLLIVDTIKRFQNEYGGDWDDMFGVANLAYVRACLSYSRKRGKFSTWVSNTVRYALLEENEYAVRRHLKLPRVRLHWSTVESRLDGTFRFEQICSELSKDARYVVRLALDGPRLNRRHALSRLRGILADRGWSMVRIVGSFNEIRRAIL